MTQQQELERIAMELMHANQEVNARNAVEVKHAHEARAHEWTVSYHCGIDRSEEAVGV
jgi:hypothetical protein